MLEGTIDGLPPLREVIRRHDLSARKSLGQNFLLDLNLTGRIARAAGPLDGVTVVEIGPGPGGLTRALLAEGARRVIAIERDERALAALAGNHGVRIAAGPRFGVNGAFERFLRLPFTLPEAQLDMGVARLVEADARLHARTPRGRDPLALALEADRLI